MRRVFLYVKTGKLVSFVAQLRLDATSFYRAAYMQGGLSYGKGVCLSVCPSVRLSVTRVNCDKTNESSAEILIPYVR